MAADPPEAESPLLIPPTAPVSAPALGSELERGATLGRYVVIEKLGSGGMGEVYAAFDRTLDRKVALKLLRGETAGRRALLLREAHVMAKLSHPNVVPVFDAGVVDERLFIAMEFVQGRTLVEWQREEGRTPREILRAYVEAGRGLAAAHASGIVHRDFKPANVLVSASGHVKVTDFGVAQSVDERGGASATTSPAIVGTPGFMAPEQRRGLAVDARADQYSFCMALRDALERRLPAHARRAIARGLREDRDARFPAMEDLLRELQRDPTTRRRRWIAGVASVLALGATAVWGQHERQARRAQLCTGAELEAGDAWNDDARRRVEEALITTGVPYAADTARRVRERIDAYMSGWTAMHRRTCEATRLRKEQPESVMDAKMACLERRRDEVRALVRVLSSADREVASKAVEAASDLTSLDGCDVTPAADLTPEPTDTAKRAELAALRAGLSTVKENLDAGRASLAREQVGPLVARARALDYAPASAEALLLSATSRADSGDWANAVEDARQSVVAADAGRDDVRRATAEVSLVHWLTETGRLDEAGHWSDLAEATLRRTGETGEQRAEWLDAVGWLLYRRGKTAEATERLRAAADTALRASATPQRIAKIERALADAEAASGRYDEAQSLIDRADRRLIEAFGSDHPNRIPMLVNRSVIAARADRRRDELDYAREAISLAERVAPDHPVVGVAYLDACDALLRLHDYDAALADCRQAIAKSRQTYGPNATYVAYADTTAGDVLVGLGRYDEAQARFAEAVDIHERTDTRGDSDYADALRGLGVTALRSGRSREARTLFEKARAAIGAGDSADDAAIVAAIEAGLTQTNRP